MKHIRAGSVLFAVWGFLAACEDKNQYAPPPPPVVTVSPPVQKTVTEYLELTGTTEAVETVEIRARVKGYLQEVQFEEGEFVTKGKPLFVIEPDEYEQAVRRAKASLSSAKAQLSLAEATLKRMEQAAKTNAVSQIDVDESRAKREGAVAAVDLANAQLDTAQLNLKYTTIHAPISGRIGRSLVDAGNLVGATDATLLTTIVRYDPMEAYFDVSERDLLNLAARKRARQLENGEPEQPPDPEHWRTIRLELGLANEKGYPHPGNIQYIDQGVDSATGTLLLRGRFPNPSHVLVPGLFVRIRIPSPFTVDALLVPERALGSDQRGWYVLVVDSENVVQKRNVEIGKKEDDMVVVTSGLTPEESVVVNGILRARPGAKVTPKRQEAAGAAAPAAAPGD